MSGMFPLSYTMLLKIRTQNNNGCATRSIELHKGDDVLSLGSEAQFLTLVGATHHEFNTEIIGDPKREYVQAHLARWTAKQLKVKSKELYAYISNNPN